MRMFFHQQSPQLRAGWLTALLAFVCATVYAQTPSSGSTNELSRFKKETEGWYFYKDPKERLPPPPPEPAPITLPALEASKSKEALATSPPALKPMSVAWIQKYLPLVRETAIDDPSERNVRIFLYMQRVMLDKAENFTNAAVLAGSSDPGLNEDVRVPTATALAQAQNNREEGARRAALRSLSGKGGLWIFVDSKCMYCETAVFMGRRLAAAHGYELRVVSIDGLPPKGMRREDILVDVNRQAFRRFGLKLVPATVLAIPPEKVAIIGHGAVTDLRTLETNVLAAMRALDLMPDDQRNILLARQRGLLTTAQLKAAEGASQLAANQRADASRSSDDPSPAKPAEASPEEVMDLVSSAIAKSMR